MIKVKGNLKILAMLLIDAGLVVIALALGVYLRFDWSVPVFWMGRMEGLLLPAVLISLIIFFILGL